MAYSPVSALCLTYNSKSKVYPSAEMECSALVRSRISYASNLISKSLGSVC